ncbi:hypothetical protein CFP56_039485 [Quercus suber]|uniref:Pentatricopeptide repeat-containing protein n=1 Tax=Quercus suber TaxID=58331 RepID=A0AAW0IZ17_QUESU
MDILHSCKDLQVLRQAHASLIVSKGSNRFSVASKLISLYAHFHDSVMSSDPVNQVVSSLQSDVIYGEMVLCVSTKMGFGFDLYFCFTMIKVYVKCGCVVYARKLFD